MGARSLLFALAASVHAVRHARETCEERARKASQPPRTCGLPSGDRRLLLLGSSGIASAAIQESLDELVMALPDASRKLRGGGPDYSKLTLLAVYDPCMLKRAFWDRGDRDFGQATGMNYKKLGVGSLTPELVLNATGRSGESLDGEWCYDEWTSSGERGGPGGLADAGFGQHSAVSIMGEMMTPAEFRVLVDADLGLAGPGEVRGLLAALRARDVPEALADRISAAHVIAFSGGNPDLIAFVFAAFPAVAGLLAKRVRAGQAVYLGRSAGGMVAGADAAFSSEPTPHMLRTVLQGQPRGLGLLPRCIVKPHFKVEASEAYATALERITGMEVARIPDGQAMRCVAGCCLYVGKPANPADLRYSPGAGHYSEHLTELFKTADQQAATSSSRWAARLGLAFASSCLAMTRNTR